MRGDLRSSLFCTIFNIRTTLLQGLAPSTARPLDVSSAISFVLSAQCCSTQILDNPNHIAPSGTSYFCKAHSLCVKSQYLASICCKLELCSQNTCRTSAHKHTLQENVKIVIHGADTFVYLQIKGYDLFISIYL